jgi:hypothetical protein
MSSGSDCMLRCAAGSSFIESTGAEAAGKRHPAQGGAGVDARERDGDWQLALQQARRPVEPASLVHLD